MRIPLPNLPALENHWREVLALAALEVDEFALLVEAKKRESALHAGVLAALILDLERALGAVARMRPSLTAPVEDPLVEPLRAHTWSGIEAVNLGETPIAPLFDRWKTAQSPNLRRLALAALVRQSRDASGWTPAIRAALSQLRADPAPLVSGAAQFTFWPGEE